MPTKRHSSEQIISKLGEVEVQGMKVTLTCKQVKNQQQTHFMWCREYGDLRMGQAKRLKQLKRKMTDSKKCWWS
ncbi:hypothetical protein [Gimesia algae]|uniref:Transposase n=1 Tax=Gimesia algae TaxID=2527971 RepID=A0A517VHV6_9PLAN|nr:hypothetical protein [Gimesia algae]QDT92552.1 hypothetical protein Pan161_42200 [Gimesia algae]